MACERRMKKERKLLEAAGYEIEDVGERTWSVKTSSGLALELSFPADYPFKPPWTRFLPPIPVHDKIDADTGCVCMDTSYYDAPILQAAVPAAAQFDISRCVGSTAKLQGDPEAGRLNVTVRTLFRKELVIEDLSSEANVAHLMVRIKAESGLACHLQRLMFDGKELEPRFGLALRDYQITDGDTLNLVSKSRGGGINDDTLNFLARDWGFCVHNSLHVVKYLQAIVDAK